MMPGSAYLSNPRGEAVFMPGGGVTLSAQPRGEKVNGVKSAPV